MSVWYLDIDDEITDAVARLRGATDERVVLVVPPGSRIATGRINFKLLAREAASRDLALAIASPDAQVRALATAAGLLARGSASEAEGALERGETVPPPPTTDVASDGEGTEDLAGGEVTGSTAADVPVLVLPDSLDADEPPPARHGRRRRVAVVAGVAVGLVAIAGVASFTVLPTATITIHPLMTAIGPLTVDVTADPAQAQVDAAAGRVPAVLVDIPLSVEGRFDATGQETRETKATGEVVFSWEQPDRDRQIPAGTPVQTPDGTVFQTTEPVLLRRPATGAAQVTAPVAAVAAGPEGNVAAGTISVAPVLEQQGISVTNRNPTSGGTRVETKVITQDDYSRAFADLTNLLEGQLGERLADPESIARGLTLFTETAQRGQVMTVPAADELVGQPADHFALRAEASARATAVDESLVDQVATQRLADSAPAGTAIMAATVRTDPGAGTASDGTIRYAATASGAVRTLIEAADLVARVAGRPIATARAILEPFGNAQVSVWPEFVGDLPSDTSRISLSILDPEANTE